MDQRVSDRTARIMQNRDSQSAVQAHQKTERASVLAHNYDPLESVTCRIGSSACAAKHASVTQRAELFHPVNERRKVQSMLRLQRQYGNRFVQRVIVQNAIQTKLKIGQPGDIYEKEADRVAEQVMKMSKVQRKEDEEEEPVQTKSIAEQVTPFAQRQEIEEEEEQGSLQTRLVDSDLVQRQEELEEEKEEPIQTKQTRRNTPQLSFRLEAQIQSLKGSGEPLTESDRTFFEPRFGHDFSHVRVHTNTKTAAIARAINARAFTIGQDIFFGTGQYVSKTKLNRKLLAHELAHSIQQSNPGSSVRMIQRIPFEPGGGYWETPKGPQLVREARKRWQIRKTDPRVSGGQMRNYLVPPEWFWSPNRELDPQLYPGRMFRKNRKGVFFKTKLKEWGIPIRYGESIVNKQADLWVHFRDNASKKQLARRPLKKRITHCNDFVYDSIYEVTKRGIPLSGHRHYLSPRSYGSSRLNSLLGPVFRATTRGGSGQRRMNVKMGDVMFLPKLGAAGHMEIVTGTKGSTICTIGTLGGTGGRWSAFHRNMFFRRLI